MIQPTRQPTRLGPGPVPGRATVRVPGTCGELIQGWLDGSPLLVSCPIDRFATATVELRSDGAIEAPDDRPKARRALELALAAYGGGFPAGSLALSGGSAPQAGLTIGRRSLGARLTLASDLPPAKGFGSSTADVAATIGATARALGHAPRPADVARLALQIEPTDSTIFPGLVAFDHRAGSRLSHLGPAPALHLAVLDLGGTVDTLAFNEPDRSDYAHRHAGAFRHAFGLLRAGLRDRRPDLIGRAATLSAELHQAILRKPELPGLIELARSAGALGVVIAHSGTLTGLLTDRGSAVAAELGRLARATLGRPIEHFVARLIDGGPQTEEA